MVKSMEEVVRVVKCPKCRVSGGNRCRNMNKPIVRYETDTGQKRIRYTALAKNKFHRDRQRAYMDWYKEKLRREHSEGITEQERQEIDQLRQALREAQEAERTERMVMA